MLYFIREQMDYEFDHILGIFDNEQDVLEAFKALVEKHIENAPRYTDIRITRANVTNALGGLVEEPVGGFDDDILVMARYVDNFDIEFNTLEELAQMNERCSELFRGFTEEDREEFDKIKF